MRFPAGSTAVGFMLPAAILVHIYTGIGAVIAFLALDAVCGAQYNQAFLLLFVASMVDYSDGTLARWLNVSNVLPQFDGKVLDHVVDYFSNVILPFYLLWSADLLPEPRILWVSFGLLVGAYRFSRRTSADADSHFFCGLPSPWIEMSFYVFFLDLGTGSVVVLIVILSLLVIVPYRFFRVSSRRTFNITNLSLMAFWWFVAFGFATEYLASRAWIYLSIAHPLAYVILNLYENRRYPNS